MKIHRQNVYYQSLKQDIVKNNDKIKYVFKPKRGELNVRIFFSITTKTKVKIHKTNDSTLYTLDDVNESRKTKEYPYKIIYLPSDIVEDELYDILTKLNHNQLQALMKLIIMPKQYNGDIPSLLNSISKFLIRL